MRHSTLRSQAKFLRTEARPHIVCVPRTLLIFCSLRVDELTLLSQFYRPWIITANQKLKIRQQRHDVEDTVERELGEFDVRKGEHARKYGLETQSAKVPASPERPEAEKPSEPLRKPDQEGHASAEGAEPQYAPEREHHDDSNDVVVEAGEDVVIY